MVNVRKIREFDNGSREVMVISNNVPYILLCFTGYEDGDWGIDVYGSEYCTDNGNMMIMPNTQDIKFSLESEDRESWEESQEFLYGNFEELVG